MTESELRTVPGYAARLATLHYGLMKEGVSPDVVLDGSMVAVLTLATGLLPGDEVSDWLRRLASDIDNGASPSDLARRSLH